MKKDEKNALAEKSAKELQAELQKLQQEMTVARLAVRAGKETNISKPANLGRKIAVIKTILRMKQNTPDVVQSQSVKNDSEKKK